MQSGGHATSAVPGHTPLHCGCLSDERLVELARAGHEPAFEAIVQRYRAPLQSYCRRWLDPHRAEEVVQHTLMKAFVCLRDDARPLALRPWLYRVAHNAALNALEKKGSDWEQLDENYDGVPQPPQVAERRAHFLRVVSEIDSLPERQRAALLLNEFEGRCYADIAAELDTSESGVRGLLRRARRQLREAAALILPLPALRELGRSGVERAASVDRTGDIIGSAGAAGGVGAVGGIAKVAAGVLAAGTLAGGGTALEHKTDVWSSPVAPAQAAPAVTAERPQPARPVVSARAGDESHPAAARRRARERGRALPDEALAFVPAAAEDGEGADRIDGSEPAEGWGEETEAPPAPVEELPALVPDTVTGAEPQEEVAGEVRTSEPSEPADETQDSKTTQPPPDDGSAGSSGSESSPESQPATSSPSPQRG